MYSGLGRRKEPHAERKYQAIQAIEKDHGPRSGLTAAMRLGNREYGRTDMPRVLENRPDFSEACRFQQHTSR